MIAVSPSSSQGWAQTKQRSGALSVARGAKREWSRRPAGSRPNAHAWHRISKGALETPIVPCAPHRFGGLSGAYLRMADSAQSVRYLLLLLRAFWHCLLFSVTCVFHLGITVATAFVLRIEFFADLRFRVCLEIFVDTLIILIGAAAVRWPLVLATSKVFVLKRGCKNRP
jgi:hypothetical protein